MVWIHARPAALACAALSLAAAVSCRGRHTPTTEAEPRHETSDEARPTTLTSAAAALPSPLPALATASPTGSPDVPALVTHVSPSVVNITATQELRAQGGDGVLDFFFRGTPRRRPQGDTLKRRGLGTGFLVDHVGHVVTNAHVIADATSLRITLADEREVDAKVKGRDERLDLAVLELAGVDPNSLPVAPLGRSDDLRVGEYVVAIGNPFGLGNTVTMGIVSAKGRELGAGPYDDFIQTDASINPGNSGGPLFNARGEVVGISTAIAAEAQGIGFAIPVDALKDVLPQLLEKGYVSRGSLGLGIQQVDATLAKALGLPKPMGAVIAEVRPGSASERAGLHAGEVIVAVDDVSVTHAHDLPRLIARRPPHARVTLKVVDPNGATRNVQATLDELRDDERRRSSAPADEPKPPTTNERGEFGIELGDDRRRGVVVRTVDPSSMASDSLEPGDIVREVNGIAVTSASEATTRVRATQKDRPLLLKIDRRGNPRFVALERR